MEGLIDELAWQICTHLNLGVERIPPVTSTLGLLSDTSIFVMAEVRTLVAKLDSLEITLAEESGSTNFGLISVDVLLYDQKQKIAGILASQAAAIGRLGKIVGEIPDLSILNEFRTVLGLHRGRDYVGKLDRR